MFDKVMSDPSMLIFAIMIGVVGLLLAACEVKNKKFWSSSGALHGTLNHVIYPVTISVRVAAFIIIAAFVFYFLEMYIK
tara:strand:- start:8349 stop:8585 length:237 start_codon:yes stop_codon:yes gene_type:complete